MLKYVRGSIIKKNKERNVNRNLLILNDVTYDSESIFCLEIDKKNKPIIDRIIKKENDDYEIMNYFVHKSVVDLVVQKIRETKYTNDDNSNNKDLLLQELVYTHK